MKRISAQLLLFISLLLSCHSFAAETNPPIQLQEIMSTSTTWDGAPIQYPSGTPKTTGGIITLAPGAETGWHLHPIPCLALILEGELTVYLKNGRSKKCKAGETLAEVVNTPHNGKNLGTIPTKIVVFYIGNTDLKTTILCP